MTNPVLELRNIVTGYGPIEVLHGVSLRVHPGEMVTMIGANGAGKSTTLRIASRLQPVTQGQVLFAGDDVTAQSAPELVKRGLVQVPEGRRVFPRLTVRENLELGAFLRRDPLENDFERVFTLFPILKERASQFAGTLSGGEQQMLAIGRALMSKPKILLLDEPSMGISPLLTKRIFDTLVALNREGMTLLVVEQNAHLALKHASRAYVLETGRIILDGPASELARNPKVQEAYLGG